MTSPARKAPKGLCPSAPDGDAPTAPGPRSKPPHCSSSSSHHSPVEHEESTVSSKDGEPGFSGFTDRTVDSHTSDDQLVAGKKNGVINMGDFDSLSAKIVHGAKVHDASY